MRKIIHAGSLIILACFLFGLLSGCVTSPHDVHDRMTDRILDSIEDGRYTAAAQEALVYLADFPEDIEFLSLLLHSYILNEDLEEAAETAGKLAVVDEDNSLQWNKLYCRLLADSGQTQSAIHSYERLLEDNPDDKEISFSLMTLFIDSDMYQDALDIATGLYMQNVKDKDVIEKIIEIGEGGNYDWVDSYKAVLNYL